MAKLGISVCNPFTAIRFFEENEFSIQIFMHVHHRYMHSGIFSMYEKYSVTNMDFSNKISHFEFFSSSFLLRYMRFFRLIYACIYKYRKHSNRDNENKLKSYSQNLQFTCYLKKRTRRKVVIHKVM